MSVLTGMYENCFTTFGGGEWFSFLYSLSDSGCMIDFIPDFNTSDFEILFTLQ